MGRMRTGDWSKLFGSMTTGSLAKNPGKKRRGTRRSQKQRSKNKK